jgi:CBS domain-containing protein
VLVIDDDELIGNVTQGDCAIKVLLTGLVAKKTLVGQVMTGTPVTVKPDDRLEGCMAMMAARGFSHLSVLDGARLWALSRSETSSRTPSGIWSTTSAT